MAPFRRGAEHNGVMEDGVVPPAEGAVGAGRAAGDTGHVSVGYGDHRHEAVAHEELMPPSDSGALDPSEQLRVDVDAMVDRCLDAAMGLARRSLDPDGTEPEGADEARRIVMRSLAECARSRVADDDEAVRSVMCRTAELALDALVGCDGSAVPGAGVSLEAILPGEVDPERIAPAGRIPFAVLQDTMAAARAVDRQVAYTTLAASVSLSDTSTLLGVEPAEVYSSLDRTGRRLAESCRPAGAGGVGA